MHGVIINYIPFILLLSVRPSKNVFTVLVMYGMSEWTQDLVLCSECQTSPSVVKVCFKH